MKKADIDLSKTYQRKGLPLQFLSTKPQMVKPTIGKPEPMYRARVREHSGEWVEVMARTREVDEWSAYNQERWDLNHEVYNRKKVIKDEWAERFAALGVEPEQVVVKQPIMHRPDVRFEGITITPEQCDKLAEFFVGLGILEGHTAMLRETMAEGGN